MLRYQLVKGSAHYIAQNRSYGGKFKAQSRFDDLHYSMLHGLHQADFRPLIHLELCKQSGLEL